MTALETAPQTESMDRPVRIASAAGAGLALVPFALCTFSGETGAEITASLVDDATSLQVGAITATVAGALLIFAAVRLGAAVAGMAGRVLTAAGIAVAVLFVAYYASFGAGAVVADEMLTNPGAGLGEGTALLVNLTEITRYAPSLALTAAAVAARAWLPKGVWIAAAVLVVLTLFPMTSWVAALLIPLWLGISGAAVSARG